MALSLVSFNYKHTPVSLREKLAIPADKLTGLLNGMREGTGVNELMMLSTCNRVEIYYVSEERQKASQEILAWMKNDLPGWDEEMEQCGVFLDDTAALNHLFRVACSLESMVIGEPQILGQVKDSFQIARESRAIGPFLNGLMQRVFHTAKRVRTETSIARFPVSVSYMAVELAGLIFDRLDDKTVMVIGAGEMAELVVEHLQRAGVSRLLITNRTFSNAVALAERYQGDAVRIEHMLDYLAEADIIIGSTGAPEFVVDAAMARQAHRARKGKPIFFIDIAVPRDISPEVDQLPDVYCYDIDDLQSASDANRKEREAEAAKAQGIIEEEIQRFGQIQQTGLVVHTIRALRESFLETSDREVDAALTRIKNLSPAEQDAVRGLVRKLVNKLLHPPSTRLKEIGSEQNGPYYAEVLADLFELSPESLTEGAVGESSARKDSEAKGGEDNVLKLRVPGSR